MVDDNRRQQAGLGCGSLILIALIVLIFSGGGRIHNIERELRGLRAEIAELTNSVEAQTKEIHALQEKVEKVNQ